MRILTIGRYSSDPSALPDIVLPDDNKDISRLQAELTITDSGEYYLVDCGGSNPTLVKRGATWERLKQDFVRRGDLLKFGSLQMSVEELASKAPSPRDASPIAREPISRNLKPRRNPMNGEVEFIAD